MRKVSRLTAQALRNGRKVTIGNTKVDTSVDKVTTLELHGNCIAVLSEEGHLYLRDSGWRTTTTKERLNAILTTFGINARIYQRAHRWYMMDNGIETIWSGSHGFKLETV